MFWNHSKQHSSKTLNATKIIVKSFGTIRNNTALKRNYFIKTQGKSFGTIRNNTALKLCFWFHSFTSGFGTIRNNTALKLCFSIVLV